MIAPMSYLPACHLCGRGVQSDGPSMSIIVHAATWTVPHRGGPNHLGVWLNGSSFVVGVKRLVTLLQAENPDWDTKAVRGALVKRALTLRLICLAQRCARREESPISLRCCCLSPLCPPQRLRPRNSRRQTRVREKS